MHAVLGLENIGSIEDQGCLPVCGGIAALLVLLCSKEFIHVYYSVGTRLHFGASCHMNETVVCCHHIAAVYSVTGLVVLS